MTVTAKAPPAADERLSKPRAVDQLIKRPEIGAMLGALLVFVFFSVVTEHFLSLGGAATWLDDASMLGIMAVAVALLMIGGEFDLSAGVMTASTALVTAILSTQLGLNAWLSLLVSLAFALSVGALNGWLVMRTGLPSFIVTLGSFLALQGLNLGVTRLVTGSVQVSGMREAAGYESAGFVFASTFQIGGTSFYVSIIWWVLFTIIASTVLLRTKFGNWIFATGGSKESARAVGVPVTFTKIALFMGVGAGAWFVGMHILFSFNTVQSGEGVGNEFLYIIAAVIGGCLLTGGYGSAIGPVIGAFIFGMVSQGIVYADWNPDWFKAFLGVMLLVAALVNLWVRRQATRR
jgi:simple sugar transport system permease protein